MWMLNLHVYPFIDVPNHLSASTIVRYYDEPGNNFKDYYSIPDKIKSNTAHLYFTSSSLFPSVDFANKLYYLIYVILFPLSILIVIKKLNGNIWYSLFAFMFVFNFEVTFGFVGYTMSVPFLILLILFLIDFFETPTYKYTFYLMFLNILLFFFHFQTAIYALVILLIFSLYNYKHFWDNILKKLIAIVPVLVLMIISYSADSSPHYQGLFPYFLDYYSSTFWITLIERLRDFFVLENFFLFTGEWGWTISTLIVLFIIFPFVFLFFKNRKELVEKLKSGNNVYFTIFLIISLILFIILPDNLPGQNIVFQRFSIFIILTVIILSSTFKFSKYLKNYVPIGIAVVFIYMALLSNYFFDFKSETKYFTEDIFPDAKNGQTLSGLIYDGKFRANSVYIHFQSYYTIWKKGITSNSNLDFRYSFIRRKVSMDCLPPYLAWVSMSDKYDDRYKYMDYILTRDSTERKITNFAKIRSSGTWHLYENISDTINHYDSKIIYPPLGY